MTTRHLSTVFAFLFALLPIHGCKDAQQIGDKMDAGQADSGKTDSGGPVTTRPTDDASPEAREDTSSTLVLPDAYLADNAPPGCQSDPNEDFDKDGYTVAQGDCNDCDPNTNPGALDVPGNNIDEDCSGKADDEPNTCDSGPASAADDPLEAARSLGLCRTTAADATGKAKTWGVVSAKWVFPDGTTASLTPDFSGGFGTPSDCVVPGGGGTGKGPHPLSRSTLSAFGPNVSPQSGKTMVALSSGVAQPQAIYDSPERAAMCTKSKTPPGFPMSSKAACPGQTIMQDNNANDGVALELAIRTPTNAHGFSFDFDFYTFEFPRYVCSMFNDFFVALLGSQEPSVPANKNISFDKEGNPVCVNNAFVEVCTPQQAGGKPFACPLGRKELQGTGFDAAKNSAATSWLRTNAKIVPGETITIRFAIWDAGDEILDSTVLLDNLQWVADAGKATTGTDRPPPIL
jgi:hypothetical protein